MFGIFDWAVDAGDYTAQQDYEQAISKVWNTTSQSNDDQLAIYEYEGDGQQPDDDVASGVIESLDQYTDGYR